jgi:hypothetical protein
MILRVGFRTFEFQDGREVRKRKNQDTLYFSSYEDALGWLKEYEFLHVGLILRVREYVVRYSEDPECFRMTNHQALERMALLLYLRRIVVVFEEQRTSSGIPSESSPPTPPAFPLSERSSRTSAPTKPPPGDAPTFDPNLAAATQADCLKAAAAEGKPFCSEVTNR